MPTLTHSLSSLTLRVRPVFSPHLSTNRVAHVSSVRSFWEIAKDPKLQSVKSAMAESESSIAGALWDQFTKAQKTQERLSFPALARTVVHNSTMGLLSVNSSRDSIAGFPKGSLIIYVAGEDGKPIFSLTSLAAHTRDLLADAKASLLIIDPNNLNIRNQQVILTGRINKVEKDTDALKERYLKKLPNAFYVNFGDFSWFRMDDIVEVRYSVDVQSFARFSTFSGQEYLETKPDPVAECVSFVQIEIQQSKKIVESLTGFEVDSADLVRLDALGVEFNCVKSGLMPFTCRAAFSKRSENLEEVREEVQKLINQSHNVL